MTTTAEHPAIESVADAYPTLLRIGTIYDCSLGGMSFSQASAGFYCTQDLAVGLDGLIYVLARSNENRPGLPRARFIRVDMKASPPAVLDTLVPAPDGRRLGGAAADPRLLGASMCALSSDGVLFTTIQNENRVLLMTTEGETIGLWGEGGDGPGQLNAPAGIAFDRDEMLWIANGRDHRLQRFTRDGRYLSGFGEFGAAPGRLSYPWGVAVDPIDGSVVVADWGNHRVQRFNAEGQLLQIVDRLGGSRGQLNHPSGVTVDHYGDLYVVDRGSHRVLLFDREGRFVESLIGDATLNESAIAHLLRNREAPRRRANTVDLDQEKRFSYPLSVKLDPDDRLYVVETGRQRIQVYRKLVRVLTDDEVAPRTMFADPAVVDA